MNSAKFVRMAVLAAALVLSATVLSAGEVHEKAQEGDLIRVKELIEADPDLLEAKDTAGSTPLLAACAGGRLDVARYLVEKGADIHAGDNENSGALHLAAVSGSVETIGFLIDRGIEVDIRDDNGMTPLLFAGYRGNSGAVEFLLSKGADINAVTSGGGSMVHAASYSGNTELLGQLLEKGASADLPPDQYGNTPLAAAAMRCRDEAVKMLVANGAAMEPDHEGAQPPMITATWRACDGVIRILLDSGADVNVTDEGGGTPLGTACAAGHPETARMLVDSGADVDHVDDHGYFPLLYAARSGDPDIVKLLLSMGADLSRANNDGFTPMMMAAREGNAEVVSLLADAGSDLAAADRERGITATHLAAICGYSDIVKKLIKAGADMDIKDNAGLTPARYAARYGNESSAKCLKDAGCDPVRSENDFGSWKYLTKDIKEGEAYVWHLGHSGWAVRTKDNLLLFDCWENGRKPDEPCLSNGFIVPSEVRGLDVTVFVSHAHGDHYSQHILGWKEKMEGVDYVIGFPCGELEDYIHAGPREEISHGGMTISTIESNDSGVGFLVEVDGVTVFHAGDHANRQRDFSGPYTAEIDHLAGRSGQIDLAFLPVSGCGFGDQEAVKLGVFYALEKLDPAVFFPMHNGKHPTRYKVFEKEAAEMGFKAKTACASAPGDRFHFRKKGNGEAVLTMQD